MIVKLEIQETKLQELYDLNWINSNDINVLDRYTEKQRENRQQAEQLRKEAKALYSEAYKLDQ